MVHECYGIFWSGQFEALVLHVHGEISMCNQMVMSEIRE